MVRDASCSCRSLATATLRYRQLPSPNILIISNPPLPLRPGPPFPGNCSIPSISDNPPMVPPASSASSASPDSSPPILAPRLFSQFLEASPASPDSITSMSSPIADAYSFLAARFSGVFPSSGPNLLSSFNKRPCKPRCRSDATVDLSPTIFSCVRIRASALPIDSRVFFAFPSATASSPTSAEAPETASASSAASSSSVASRTFTRMSLIPTCFFCMAAILARSSSVKPESSETCPSGPSGSSVIQSNLRSNLRAPLLGPCSPVSLSLT